MTNKKSAPAFMTVVSFLMFSLVLVTSCNGDDKKEVKTETTVTSDTTLKVKDTLQFTDSADTRPVVTPNK